MTTRTAKVRRWTGLVALTAFLLPVGAAAQDTRERLLVDATWLLANYERPDVVVVHAGTRSAWERAHVPGSRFLSIDDLAVSSGGHDDPDHVMLDLPDDLGPVVRALEAAGVRDGATVVVAWDGDRVTAATRVLWTLQAVGFDGRASLLDGGMDAWSAAGGPVTEVQPAPGKGRLTLRPALDRRVSGPWILERLDGRGVALVDARAPASYDGVRAEMEGRAGHIPGAGNLPVSRLFDEAGRLRPAHELRALFAEAGVESGDTVVAYCHIGLFATSVVFAARTLGFDARLYDGSMNEWARRADWPLEGR